MSLDDRKIKILNAIVNDYILTAEPVGSRTIEKRYNLGISAATIRNEMSDLEELGFLIAPHTSAGRVPSDKGFRLYVDNLIERDLSTSLDSFQDIITNNLNHIENLMEETARLVSQYTNYATVVSDEAIIVYKIKRLQLVPVDDENILLIIIFDKSIVRNECLKTNGNYYSIEYYETVTNALNKFLAGIHIDELTSELVNEIIDYVNASFDYDNYIIKDIIQKIVEQASTNRDTKVYRSGLNNIIEYPEFYNNASKIKNIFESIEQKEFITNLLSEDDINNKNEVKFEIHIGEENSIKEMKDLTVFKVRCKLGDDRFGTIGIIGPKRMNYEQTIAFLNGLVNTINNSTRSIGYDTDH